jgi:hypothetical protein
LNTIRNGARADKVIECL